MCLYWPPLLFPAENNHWHNYVHSCAFPCSKNSILQNSDPAIAQEQIKIRAAANQDKHSDQILFSNNLISTAYSEYSATCKV
jgi:hypothetical protein